MVLIIAWIGCATEMKITEPTPREIGEALKVGHLANPQITEASGLASSRLYPSVLWIINDGGNDPLLFAVGIDGADLGTFRVDGAENYDWEADIWSLGVTLFFLASFSYPFGVDESQGEGLQDLL